MSVTHHPGGNTTVTTHYRCTVCGFRGKDSHTYLATESGAHRPVVFASYAPWWCQEHGGRAMVVVKDPDEERR